MAKKQILAIYNSSASESKDIPLLVVPHLDCPPLRKFSGNQTSRQLLRAILRGCASSEAPLDNFFRAIGCLLYAITTVCDNKMLCSIFLEDEISTFPHGMYGLYKKKNFPSVAAFQEILRAVSDLRKTCRWTLDYDTPGKFVYANLKSKDPKIKGELLDDVGRLGDLLEAAGISSEDVIHRMKALLGNPLCLDAAKDLANLEIKKVLTRRKNYLITVGALVRNGFAQGNRAGKHVVLLVDKEKGKFAVVDVWVNSLGKYCVHSWDAKFFF